MADAEVEARDGEMSPFEKAAHHIALPVAHDPDLWGKVYRAAIAELDRVKACGDVELEAATDFIVEEFLGEYTPQTERDRENVKRLHDNIAAALLAERQAGDRRVEEILAIPQDAINALTDGQQQIDHDGTFCGVSRQALDEVLAAIAAIRSRGDKHE